MTDVAPVVIPAPAARSSRWLRPALWTLLAATALLYLWGLGASGYANEFYAAAVQSGTQNWKAWLFGSLDPGNAITVDKPPAAMWVMGLSARLFGFSAWSMLLPQALMGVGSVALLYGAVRRTSGPVAGLLAGTLLALTPLAALMFRYNDPDALLVLLLVTAAYCTVRALDGSTGRWVALAGTALGFAFLTKMMAAFLVAPALVLVVLVATPGSMRTRIRNLLIGLATTVVSAGWFVVLVAIWPANSRPYIGGSTDNSLLQLALAYNGLGRVLGGDGNHGFGPRPGGGPPGGSLMFGGGPGIGRLFGMSMGTEISWLLPAALIGLIAMLWLTRSAPWTGPVRASLLLWGGWLLVAALVFSYMRGIMHPYYTIELAPAIAAVLAIALRELWWGRHFGSSRASLAVMLVATGVWNFVLLDRTPDWLPWLRWALLIGTIATAFVLVIGAHRAGHRTAIVCAAGLLFGLGATAAYTVEAVAVYHGGAIPTSGPGHRDQRATDNRPLSELLVGVDNRWAAATVGAHTADNLELSAGKSAMAVGGFSGRDNFPTLAQFQRYVADGQIRYFIRDDTDRHGPPGHQGDPRSASTAADQITKWVTANFVPRKVNGATVYDLATGR
ncbi:glycosyltransferase family 39 protein [Mycobacterium fragae]|uniref:Glycosyl transferase n=1 Tax=Mycobacterium fragae TaxID=1260918 RepID=A0A1X1UTG8_9MYCO|nr:glycosyltransferase family 39 protein [Mycobacterium fragae]MCV7402832.1 glycosyltransferase family 39 protein [Mycobacterium fragae]ORV60135.1 glycosyl transferase [Mycobacterium fragae]